MGAHGSHARTTIEHLRSANYRSPVCISTLTSPSANCPPPARAPRSLAFDDIRHCKDSGTRFPYLHLRPCPLFFPSSAFSRRPSDRGIRIPVGAPATDPSASRRHQAKELLRSYDPSTHRDAVALNSAAQTPVDPSRLSFQLRALDPYGLDFDVNAKCECGCGCQFVFRRAGPSGVYIHMFAMHT